MELLIDITAFAGDDPLKITKQSDSFYKKCCRYMGFLEEKLDGFLSKNGFTKASTTSSLTTVRYLYQKGKEWKSIRGNLTIEGKPPQVCSLSLEVEENELSKVEAFLKTLHVPRKAISIVQ